MTPNPGSSEAIAAGCTCPVLDNAHGKGVAYQGEAFFRFSEDCPLHAPDRQADTSKDGRAAVMMGGW
jgi:hypothetical protein